MGLTLDWTDRAEVTFMDVYQALDREAALQTPLGDVAIVVRGSALGSLSVDMNTMRRLLPPPACGRCGKACEHCAAEPGPPVQDGPTIKLFHSTGTVTISCPPPEAA